MKFLALGLGAGAFIYQQRARRALRGSSARQFDDFQLDPDDAVQGFVEVAELETGPLDLDALSIEDLQAAQDLAALEVGVDRIGGAGDVDDIDTLEGALRSLGQDATVTDDFVGEQVDAELIAMRPDDAGDLYGMHTPIAVQRELPDDDQAFADGQNWLEALETSAIENGAMPGRPLDIVDDEDLLRAPHPSIHDVPVADFGSGGRRGL